MPSIGGLAVLGSAAAGEEQVFLHKGVAVQNLGPTDARIFQSCGNSPGHVEQELVARHAGALEMELEGFDPIKAAKVTDTSRALSRDEDIATIGRRENVSLVYVMRDGDSIDRVVIPVRGYGLWGTLFGYLALEGDLETISGLGFYLHKETPGLGGEVT